MVVDGIVIAEKVCLKHMCIAFGNTVQDFAFGCSLFFIVDKCYFLESVRTIHSCLMRVQTWPPNDHGL